MFKSSLFGPNNKVKQDHSFIISQMSKGEQNNRNRHVDYLAWSDRGSTDQSYDKYSSLLPNYDAVRGQ